MRSCDDPDGVGRAVRMFRQSSPNEGHGRLRRFMRSVRFDNFEEARLHAGFLLGDVLSRLGISRRSYYRWKRNGRVPGWALDLLKLHAGDLSPIGLTRWRLNRDVLYHTDLDPRYHSWPIHELLADIVFPHRRSEFNRVNRQRLVESEPSVPNGVRTDADLLIKK